MRGVLLCDSFLSSNLAVVRTRPGGLAVHFVLVPVPRRIITPDGIAIGNVFFSPSLPSPKGEQENKPKPCNTTLFMTHPPKVLELHFHLCS